MLAIAIIATVLVAIQFIKSVVRGVEYAAENVNPNSAFFGWMVWAISWYGFIIVALWVLYAA